MSEPLVEVERQDESTAILSLNRPDRRNALSIALMESLLDELAGLEADDRCRVVVLRGNGPVFCAGLDLHEAADATLAERSGRLVARTFESLAGGSLVTIAAAHGAAIAGGAGLLAACDLAVGSDDLRIAFPEVRRGLVPALVAGVLRDRLRDAELRELLLLAEPIDADRARSLALLQRVVPAATVLDEALAVAGGINAGAPGAVRATLALLRESSSAVDLEHVLDAHARARGNAEAREGFAAFREGRDPRW